MTEGARKVLRNGLLAQLLVEAMDSGLTTDDFVEAATHARANLGEVRAAWCVLQSGYNYASLGGEELLAAARRSGLLNPDELIPVRNEAKQVVTKKRTFIYLMFNGRNGLHKIGKSRKPTARERTLQGEDPATVLVHSYEAESGDDERAWHAHFQGKRVRGEWFNLTAEDVSQFVRMATT